MKKQRFLFMALLTVAMILLPFSTTMAAKTEVLPFWRLGYQAADPTAA